MESNKKERTEAVLRQVLAALQVAQPGETGGMEGIRRDLDLLAGDLASEHEAAAEIVRLLGKGVAVLAGLPEGQFHSIHRAAMDAVIAVEAYLASSDFSIYDGLLEDRAATLRDVLDRQAAPAVVDEVAPKVSPAALVRSRLEDLATQLILARPEDRSELTRIRGCLSKMVRGNLLPAPSKVRVQAAWIAMGNILSGESQDPALELAGVGREIEEAMSACTPGSLPHVDVAPVAQSQPAQTATPPKAKSEPGVSRASLPSEPSPVDAAIAAAIMPADIDPEMLNLYVAENLEHIQLAERALLDLEANPNAVGGIDTIFRAFHTIKGTSGVLGFPTIQELAHLGENLLDDIRKGKVSLTGGFIDLALESCDVLKAIIQNIENLQPGAVIPQPPQLKEFIHRLASRDTSIARTKPALVPPSAATSQASVAANAAAGRESPAPAVEAEPAEMSKAMDKGSDGLPVIEATARVSTSHLDRLINMVGELVISHASIAQDPDVNEAARPRLTRNVAHAGKIIRDLQAMTMSLRMVPLRATFQKMERLVRNLIRNSGKPVRFVTEGEDTEIDRHMVDSIGDPLVHIIRNALDHGIEVAQQRIAAGKDATGEICLRAYHSAGSMVLEVSDDGRGLQRDRIFAKAQELGWVAPGQELPDSELFAFLYKPGFTTAEKVTDISGRGVGMDVVKRSIESLRGRVELSSAPGEGTTVTLRMPLTMAVVEALSLRVGGDRYLLPTFSVLESLRPSSEAMVTITGQGEMIQWREQWVPLIRLHKMFGVSNAVTDPGRGILVIVESSHQYHALLVDELLGRQEAVVKSLGIVMGEVPGISGGTILGDGRVGLILDVNGLVSAIHGGGAGTSASQACDAGAGEPSPVQEQQ